MYIQQQKLNNMLNLVKIEIRIAELCYKYSLFIQNKSENLSSNEQLELINLEVAKTSLKELQLSYYEDLFINENINLIYQGKSTITLEEFSEKF